jgi:nicotinamidase-related amidase
MWIAAFCAVAALASAAPAHSQSVLDTWKSVPMPLPPPMQPASVDSAHTALLILDMSEGTCGSRPRCIATLPAVKRLLDQARAHKMLVVYSAGPLTSATGPTPIDPLKPVANEPMVRAPADKWVNSNLEKILKDGGITSVITVGTSSNGAVLYTASGAALRGIKAIVPVDGMSAVSPFAELYTIWHLRNVAPTVSSNVVLTKSDMITFK